MKAISLARRRWTPPVLLAATLLLLSGCLPRTAPPQQPFFYALEYPPPEVAGEPLAEVVRILPFAAAPPYSKRAILYQQADNQRQYFRYHRWLAAPAAMVGDLLGRDLAASGLFAGVLPISAPAAHTCTLGGTVTEFLEDERREPWRARIEVEIFLLDGRQPGRVVLQQRYQANEPMDRHHPAALAAAMSRALARVSASITRDVHAALQDRRRAGPDPPAPAPAVRGRE